MHPARFLKEITLNDLLQFRSESPTLASLNDHLLSKINDVLEICVEEALESNVFVSKEMLAKESRIGPLLIDFYLRECAVYGLALGRLFPTDLAKGWEEVQKIFVCEVYVSVTEAEQGIGITVNPQYKITLNHLGRKVREYVPEVFKGPLAPQIGSISRYLGSQVQNQGFAKSEGHINSTGLAILRAGYIVTSKR